MTAFEVLRWMLLLLPLFVFLSIFVDQISYIRKRRKYWKLWCDYCDLFALNIKIGDKTLFADFLFKNTKEDDKENERP